MSPDDRTIAAAHLREARMLSGVDAAEAVAWARCAAPLSLPALKLEVRLLRGLGDDSAADALIAQGLLLRPADPGLLLLHAERLLERSRPARAVELLDRALARRPMHRRTLLTAGRAAMAVGEVHRAIELARTAIDARRQDPAEAARLLFDALIADEDFDGAEAAIEMIEPSPIALRARLLRARGRPADALALIEAAAHRGLDDEARCEWIDLLESTGDLPRLTAVLEDIADAGPIVALRAAKAWLWLGDFEAALRTAKQVERRTSVRREALLVAAVAFDAVSAAKSRGIHEVLIDTAGRLQSKSNLMAELAKVRRSVDKALADTPDAVVRVLLVMDATTGQNGLSQAEQFHKAVGVDAIVLTKLDGTARGGIVLAIADRLKLPVEWIGVGETVDDLESFDPQEYVDALFAETAEVR